MLIIHVLKMLEELNNRVKTGLSLRSGSWCLEISPGYFCRKQLPSCFISLPTNYMHLTTWNLSDNRDRKTFKTYLSTENTCVLGVLCNFHFFNHFTEWGTITCTILPDNSNLLGPLCLEKEHTRNKPTESEFPCNSYIV